MMTHELWAHWKEERPASTSRAKRRPTARRASPAPMLKEARKLMRSPNMDERLDVLQKRVQALEERLKLEPQVLVIEEVPRDELKRRVAAYYAEHEGDELYPSDVAIALRADAEIVFEITQELVAEGQLS